MKSKFSMLSFVMIVIMSFGLVLPVAAQDGEIPTVNCNGLSEADCEFYTEAMSNSEAMVHSVTIPSFAADMNLEAEAESVDLSIAGSGRFVLPQAALALLSDMPQATTLEEAYDMDAVIAFYESLDAEMLLAILEGMGAQLTIDQMSFSAPGETESLSAEGFFKNSALYIHLNAPNGASAWFGEEIEITDEMVLELDAALDEMALALETTEMEDLSGQMDTMMTSVMPLVELTNQYVITTREADAEMAGQSMAVFTTTFNLNGFLADPELPAAIMSMFESLIELSGDEMTLEEMGMEINEAQIQFVLMTVGMLINESDISSTTWIGLDDMLPHKQTGDIAFDLDLSLLGDPELTSVSGAMGFDVEMTDYNTTTMDDVTVPESYEPSDRTSEFIVGGPDVIERELSLGETFSAGFTSDDQTDIYAVTLEAGESVEIELESDDYPYVAVYGPDGFEIAEFDLYYDDEMMLTAGESGMYLIELEAFWELDYDITLRAQ